MVAARRPKNGRDSVGTRCCILSAKLSAERFERVVRTPLGHRERRRFASDACHWALDATMNEDQARNRKGNGAHCLAAMRRLALNIARLHPGKQSMRVKFLKGSWSHDFLLDTIRATRRCE